MNLIILTVSDRVDDSTYRLTDFRADHIRTILKSAVGDPLEIGLLEGPQGTARIERIAADEVVLRCDSWREVPTPGPEVDLICALPRPQTLKKVLITSAMMGVRSLHLIRANRVEKSFYQSPLVQPEQQLPFLIEGLSQGKLTRLPVVQIHDRFRQFFEDDLPKLSCGASAATTRLLCSQETEATLDRVLDHAGSAATIAVGPEGGWVPFEIELMHELGFRSFTLGRWTLRVEHAVIAALAQMELLRLMKNHQ